MDCPKGVIMRRSAKSLAPFFALLLIATVEQVFAQANFYEGKTIRFVVGFSAGGGYDAYTRTMARHFGKHIAGNPSCVVDNMPGAGQLNFSQLPIQGRQAGWPHNWAFHRWSILATTSR